MNPFLCLVPEQVGAFQGSWKVVTGPGFQRGRHGGGRAGTPGPGVPRYTE